MEAGERQVSEEFDARGRLIRRDVTIAATPAIMNITTAPASTGDELTLRARLVAAEEEAARHAEAAAGFAQLLMAMTLGFLEGVPMAGNDDERWIKVPHELWGRVEGCLLEHGRTADGDHVACIRERKRPGLVAVRGVP